MMFGGAVGAELATADRLVTCKLLLSPRLGKRHRETTPLAYHGPDGRPIGARSAVARWRLPSTASATAGASCSSRRCSTDRAGSTSSARRCPASRRTSSPTASGASNARASCSATPYSQATTADGVLAHRRRPRPRERAPAARGLGRPPRRPRRAVMSRSATRPAAPRSRRAGTARPARRSSRIARRPRPGPSRPPRQVWRTLSGDRHGIARRPTALSDGRLARWPQDLGRQENGDCHGQRP